MGCGDTNIVLGATIRLEKGFSNDHWFVNGCDSVAFTNPKPVTNTLADLSARSERWPWHKSVPGSSARILASDWLAAIASANPRAHSNSHADADAHAWTRRLSCVKAVKGAAAIAAPSMHSS